jgi:hypothetical protein
MTENILNEVRFAGEGIYGRELDFIWPRWIMTKLFLECINVTADGVLRATVGN